jgi:hypothetical protein
VASSVAKVTGDGALPDREAGAPADWTPALCSAFGVVMP